MIKIYGLCDDAFNRLCEVEHYKPKSHEIETRIGITLHNIEVSEFDIVKVYNSNSNIYLDSCGEIHKIMGTEFIRIEIK